MWQYILIRNLLLASSVKLLNKPFILLGLLTLSIFSIFPPLVRADQSIGRGEIVGGPGIYGFSGVSSQLTAPTKGYGCQPYPDNAVYGLTTLQDRYKGTEMTAGLIRYCDSSNRCYIRPIAIFRDSLGIPGSYINTAINLEPDAYYQFDVNYEGYGIWRSEFYYQGRFQPIAKRDLGQTDPMDWASAGGRGVEQGRSGAFGRVDTALNSYRQRWNICMAILLLSAYYEDIFICDYITLRSVFKRLGYCISMRI